MEEQFSDKVGKISIALGMFGPPIRQQLKKQGLLIIDEENYKNWNMDREAVYRLYIRGVISNTTLEKANMRLMRSLVSNIKDIT